jgi:hypothetical protein
VRTGLGVARRLAPVSRNLSATASHIEEDDCGGGNEGLSGPNVSLGPCPEADGREFVKESSLRLKDLPPPGPVSGRRS